MQKLDGKSAVVTGAGAGVGRAYAHALAAAGAKVVVNDVGAGAEKVVAEIRAAGGSAVANRDDVSDFAAAKRIIDTAVDSFGGIDILVANAGIIRPRLMHEASAEDWSSVLAVHANGSFNCYRHAAPHMIRKKGGTIINTGAGPVQGHFPMLAAYRAAKAAILVLTLTTSRELASYNINVNSIMPGSTETAMNATYRESLEKASPEGLARRNPPAPPETVPPLGVFLCTDEGRGITGYSFHLGAKSFAVVNSRAELIWLEAAGLAWAEGELAERVPGWLAGIKPLGV